MGESKRRRRRQSNYVASLGRETQLGVAVGLVMAMLYCVYVLGLYLLGGARPFEAHGVSLGGVIAAYIGGGLACGLLYGVLHPLSRSLVGTMILGVLCASTAFFGVAVVSEGPPTLWNESEWRMVGWLGLLFGVIGGPMVRRQLRS